MKNKYDQLLDFNKNAKERTLLCKKKAPWSGAILLSHQDSNLGKQNQNLMCYHYTMGQLFCWKADAKVLFFLDVNKINFA